MNKWTLAVLVVLAVVTCVRAGDEVKRLTPEQMAAMTEAKSFTASNGLTLGYRQHLPKDLTKKHPLLVLMHGVGEVGNDNFKQLHNAAPFILGYIAEGTGHEMVFLAPQCPAGHKWMEESVWANGRVTGLRAQGGYTVDLAWEGGKLVNRKISGGRPGGYVIR